MAIAGGRRVGRWSAAAHGVEGVRSINELRGTDLGDVAAGEEGNGDVGGRDGVGEFRDGEDIERIHGEEDGVESAAEGVDGGANGIEAVWAREDAAPSGTGVADLVTEVWNGSSFWKGGQKGSAIVRVG